MLPGAVAVLGMRLVESGSRGALEAVVELVVFAGLTAAVTWVKEAPLLREAFGYLAGSRVSTASAA